jgi:hypothetical protein
MNIVKIITAVILLSILSNCAPVPVAKKPSLNNVVSTVPYLPLSCEQLNLELSRIRSRSLELENFKVSLEESLTFSPAVAIIKSTLHSANPSHGYTAAERERINQRENTTSELAKLEAESSAIDTVKKSKKCAAIDATKPK